MRCCMSHRYPSEYERVDGFIDCLKDREQNMETLVYLAHRLALEAIRALHPGVVTMALNNALWSQEEEQLLAKITSVSELEPRSVYSKFLWMCSL